MLDVIQNNENRIAVSYILLSNLGFLVYAYEHDHYQLSYS